MTGPLMLLDSASLYFRAFHGVPTTVTAPDGMPVNAVRGFLDVVARLLRERRPARLVACLDADWRPAFRVAALPAYKAHRVAPGGGETVPPELVGQVPVIEAVLDAVGLARLGVAGYEADDVIAALAARERGPVDVVSGDRDLFQLVRDDQPVRVLYPHRGAAGPLVVDEAEITRRYGIPGRAYAEFALLRGDPSDGLPGVPGIGAKTAAGLLARYRDVPSLLAALDAGEPVPAGPRLRAARDYLERARAVVLAARDVPVGPVADAVPAEPADPAGLVDLADRYNLDGPVGRLLAACRALAGG